MKLTNYIKKTLLLPFSLFLCNIYLSAQPKLKNLSEMDSSIKQSSNSILNWLAIAVGIVLGLGAIYVIYAWVTNNERKGQYAVGLVVGIVIYILVFNSVLGLF